MSGVGSSPASIDPEENSPLRRWGAEQRVLDQQLLRSLWTPRLCGEV